MAFQAEARIVCRMQGSSADVTIGRRIRRKESHPTFNSMSLTRRLFNVAITNVTQVEDNDEAGCLARAKAFIEAELPRAYSLDEGNALAIQGHAWKDGQWVRTNPAYWSYAFQVLWSGEPIDDDVQFEQIATADAQTLSLTWWVVIQPR